MANSSMSFLLLVFTRATVRGGDGRAEGRRGSRAVR